MQTYDQIDFMNGNQDLGYFISHEKHIDFCEKAGEHSDRQKSVQTCVQYDRAGVHITEFVAPQL